MDVEGGASAAVFGLGAVGLSVIQGGVVLRWWMGGVYGVWFHTQKKGNIHWNMDNKTSSEIYPPEK